MILVDAQIMIGIPVRSQPALLERTLEALRITARTAEIILLPDGSDAETAATISQLPYKQIATPQRCGGASCFNRLIHAGSAEIYILLENGAVPLPGWIERMTSTFRRYPRCGLTGPSTNHCWNEQGVLAHQAAFHVTPEQLARSVDRRFGATYKSLAPLHTLSDFCYVVRREVVEAIGDADEGYGAGPCWEMDYNIRAHRAGFLGVWTCGAYVHRTEAESFHDGFNAAELELSKQRYQQKFCGLQLRGQASGFRSHCRGESCPNFAPASLITLKISEQSVAFDQHIASTSEPVTEKIPSPLLPLVSCIMPTGNRRHFVPDALSFFEQQDYPNLELIIIDDGLESIEDLLPADPRIRYTRLNGNHQKLTVGAKRNLACEQARGVFIAHWDDDDWHSPKRIRTQVERMIGAGAQLCGTTTLYYIDYRIERSFLYAYRGSSCAWMGALMYTRLTWQQRRFSEIQVGEDVRFIASIPTIQRLDLRDLTLTVCTIHSANVSAKKTSGIFWSPTPIERVKAIMVEDAALKRALSTPLTTAQPLISCIMPTHNRRSFISLALNCFSEQSYANRELIVVDDGSDSVEDLLVGHPQLRIQYSRLHEKLSIGAKRNLACKLAQGSIIAHWDDDDWYGPDRLEYQSAPILRGEADLTGLIHHHAFEISAEQFWEISSALHRRMYVGNIHGGTLMFRKDLLEEGVRYPSISLAEDAAMVQQLVQRKKNLLALPDLGMFLYMRHDNNTWKFKSGTFLDPRGWREVARPDTFPIEILQRYSDAAVAHT